MMSSEPGVIRQMPRFKCHKEVCALQIASVLGSSLSFHEEGFAPLHVGAEFIMKHRPEAGGWYVVYSDGYASFSPAKAFEEGYSPIE